MEKDWSAGHSASSQPRQSSSRTPTKVLTVVLARGAAFSTRDEVGQPSPSSDAPESSPVTDQTAVAWPNDRGR